MTMNSDSYWSQRAASELPDDDSDMSELAAPVDPPVQCPTCKEWEQPCVCTLAAYAAAEDAAERDAHLFHSVAADDDACFCIECGCAVAYPGLCGECGCEDDGAIY